MRITLFVALVVGSWLTCPSVSAKEPVAVCAVTYGFVVNPQSELTSFKLYLPPTCSQSDLAIVLSPAWKKTACAFFSTTKHGPTYKEGEPPRERYGNFFYRPSRPDVLYPTVNAGSSKRDPVLYVQESILNTDPEAKPHVCDGNLDAQRPDV